ncbi:hypothetical protein SAMN06265222_11515 [Neorhodopirellula lusitana]|uniref:Secreted protein n=1 Tax=Neorhodopirellula lusitana TaxID=445327 RepID=A0ABY1QKT0_9BACT|nr:hypothetical protein [Neorhodopirellula lusitana]SMP72214.1 hypothetical protein SAMN06265222_11515 [Neorhodopirellula lusitana]
MKNLKFVFAVILLCAIGCDDGSGTKSIYNEDEMAKYRQTPEELRQGMLDAQKASRSRGQEMAKKMRESASN